MSRSWVWNHFEELSSTSAACQVCGKKILRSDFSTSGLIRHLLIHNISEPKKRPSEPAGESSSSKSQPPKKTFKPSKSTTKQTSIESFVKTPSLGEILAKCAAKDGFAVAAMTKSEAIRGYVAKFKYEMPKSEATVWTRIHEYYEEQLEKFAAEIKRHKEAKKKWRVLIDEWTDIKNQRYLNISLHDGTESRQAMLIPIPAGSCTSEVLLELMNTSFAQLGMDFETDICASTNDGASVMTKYGKLIPALAQLCLNHALHLAVVDILYKPKPKKKKAAAAADKNNNAENEPEEEPDIEGNNLSEFLEFQIINQIYFQRKIKAKKRKSF